MIVKANELADNNEAKEGRYIAFRGDQVEGNDGQTDEVKQESQWTITL